MGGRWVAVLCLVHTTDTEIRPVKVLALCQLLTGRIGSRPILPIKVTVTTDIDINGPNFSVGTREVRSSASSCVYVYLVMFRCILAFTCTCTWSQVFIFQCQKYSPVILYSYFYINLLH